MGKLRILIAALLVGGIVGVLLVNVGSTPPAKFWSGDYKELSWSAVTYPSEEDVCIDLELSGIVDATSGGCDFGLSEGDFISYFADSNCKAGATLIAGPVHPDVTRVEASILVDKQGTTEPLDTLRIIPAPEGYSTNFVVGLHREYGYIDSITAFGADGSVLQERLSGLNVDHEWTAKDFC